VVPPGRGERRWNVKGGEDVKVKRKER